MDHLRHIRRESDAFLSAALEGSLDTPVPSCPGWSVADLVGHLGAVQHFHGRHLSRGVTDPPPGPRPAPPETGLADWFREGTDQLIADLEAAGHDTPAWNFRGAPPMTSAFWHRRMAHEAAIHRWDVQLARGRADGFDADLALDGILEVLEVHTPSRRMEHPPQGTVTVVLTDLDRTLEAVTGDPTAGAATITGPAGEVWLALWGRRALSDLAVHGDMDLARAAVTT